MLRKGEIEDPKNAEIENDEDKIFYGQGYIRTGSNYVFSGRVQPSVPSEPATAEGGAGRSLSRLEFELQKQEGRLAELYEPLEKYGEKIIKDATYGRPIVRTGLLDSIFTDIEEQKFIVWTLKGALAEKKEEG